MLISHIHRKPLTVQPICNHPSTLCLPIHNKPGDIAQSRLKNGDRKSNVEMTLTSQWQTSHSHLSVHLIPMSIHLSHYFAPIVGLFTSPGTRNGIMSELAIGRIGSDFPLEPIRPKLSRS